MADYHTDNAVFLVYKDWESLFNSLDSNEEAGELIKALFAFAKRGEIAEFSGALKMAFIFMSQQLERDGVKWEETCARRSEYGKKGAQSKAEKQKQAKGSKSKQKVAKEADTDTEKETDTDTVTDTEKESKADKSAMRDSKVNIAFEIEGYTDNEQLAAVLIDYFKMRKAMKTPNTERAIKLCFNKLDSLASTEEEKIKVVEQSIERGWKSFYPLKEDKSEVKNTTSDMSKYEAFINNF